MLQQARDVAQAVVTDLLSGDSAGAEDAFENGFDLNLDPSEIGPALTDACAKTMAGKMAKAMDDKLGSNPYYQQGKEQMKKAAEEQLDRFKQDPTAAMNDMMGFANGISLDDVASIMDNLGPTIMQNIEAMGE